MNTQQKQYAFETQDAYSALKPIRRGSRVFIGSGCGKPQLLVDKLMKISQTLADTEILHIITAGDAPYTEKSFTHSFRHNALFVGANTRQA
ncbi:MAG: 4-hydroxybutyrate coenzyme A transferase, partial [Deltaproteobacteria bacterium]|nr:4-hydroxybutyrate coenzyme A transferase [Deltaproteobacteria bacterium]